MTLERELVALNRRLKDLKRRQEAIHMRVYTRNHGEPYPADARDGDLVVTIEAPLDWHKKQLKTEEACAASALAALIPQFPSVFCWFRSQPHALNVQVEHLHVFGVEKIQKTLGIGNYMRKKLKTERN